MNPKPLILAIDDTPVNLKTLIGVLGNHFDYDLQIATSGEEGLELATAHPPDLILLDVMMPGMDGYEVCRRLREDERLKDTPVIFITAMMENESQTIGLELGAVDYLTKPIYVPIALLRIRNQLERERLRREVEFHRDQLEQQVKERTLSLAIAKEAAEAANRLKTTILTNISHEFRSPMNGILGMVGMVKRRIQEPKLLEYLGLAEDSANRLLRTLTGLLDLAAVESSRLTLDQVSFIPAEAINSVRQEFEGAARAKGIALNFEANASDHALDQPFLGDPMRIQQIVHELVGNAIKFSHGGTVSVQTSIAFDATGKPSLVCAVADQGIGIGQDNLRLIFEPFHQVDGSLSRQYGGNGIGLALCRQLAHRMGGDIAVSSTEAEGSTFTLRLPLETPPDTVSHTTSAQDPVALLQARHAGANILVAEDVVTVQSFMTILLELAGLNVLIANNGEEAVELARSTQFDLILLDLMMPKISGIQAAEAIRRLPHYQKTPILAVTARAYEEDREDCLRVGINAHIAKPVSQQHLLKTLLHWLDRSRTETHR